MTLKPEPSSASNPRQKSDPAAVAPHGRARVIHLSGIAGVGMSSLAGLFCARGDLVSGSDTAFHPPVGDVLAEMPATLHRGFAADHIPNDADLCVVGNIVSRGNPEAEAILNRHIPYASMPAALFDNFIRGKRSIVVAGTHGKTTTSTFLAFLLTLAGRHPGYFIGGRPLDLPRGYAVGRGEDFVTEGDEYETAFFDRSSKFLKYHPDILVLTPCEYDHIDFFPDETSYKQAFANLVNQVPSSGLIVNCQDAAMNREVVARAYTPVISYGTQGNRDMGIKGVKSKSGGGFSFALETEQGDLNLESPLPGAYNAGNLAAGIAVALHLGVPVAIIRRAVSRFNGVVRRLHRLRSIGESHFYEDFAHHPTALARMLESLREMHPRHKLVCLVEPRSRSLMRGDFQSRLEESLTRADEVVIRQVSPANKDPQARWLDEADLAAALERSGRKAQVARDDEAVRRYVRALDLSRPVVVVAASNGAFGGLPQWLANLDPEKEMRIKP